jgi:hypothetical protein
VDLYRPQYWRRTPASLRYLSRGRGGGGYRFQTSDRTVVISGDTSPSPALINSCQKCDVLIHEAFSEDYRPADMPNWLQYRQKYHTTPTQLAEIANQTSKALPYSATDHRVQPLHPQRRPLDIRGLSDSVPAGFMTRLLIRALQEAAIRHVRVA